MKRYVSSAIYQLSATRIQDPGENFTNPDGLKGEAKETAENEFDKAKEQYALKVLSLITSNDDICCHFWNPTLVGWRHNILTKYSSPFISEHSLPIRNLKTISTAAESSVVSFNRYVESKTKAAPAVTPIVLDARHAEQEAEEARLKEIEKKQDEQMKKQDEQTDLLRELVARKKSE